MIVAGRVYLDANAFIYYGEQYPALAGRLNRVFRSAEAGQVTIVTSDLTLLEVLVRPIQAANVALVRAYEELLTPRVELERIAIGVDVLRRAAELRAALGLRTPDAIHVATAGLSGCISILSEDHRLKVPAELAIVRISDLAP